MRKPKPHKDLAEVITRVLCDTAPLGKADAAYLFGETKDNEGSVLAAALIIWRLGRIKRIALCGLGSEHGYPGVEAWTKKLASLGIPKAAIIAIKPAEEFPPSTHAEALALARYAKKKKWKTIYVIAPPLHQVRAFISAVSFAEREKLKAKIYSFIGTPQRWEEHIVHSQGVLRGMRSELVGKELEKLELYRRGGSLLPYKKILAYLDRRDIDK